MPKAPRFVRTFEMLEIPFRTLRGVRLLTPTPEMTTKLLGVLGRSLSLYEVWLHAFTFLSNHGHMMMTVRNAEAYAGFVGHFLRNTACAVQSVTGWEGPVWSATPRPIAVLDDLSSLRRLRYVLSNGVKEGLVETPLDWPGASGARSMLSDEPIATRWHGELGEIALTPLPCFRDLPAEQRRSAARTIVDDITVEAARTRDGRPCLGVPALLAQDPFEPTRLERGFAPIAHAATISTLNDYIAQRNAFIDGYYSSAHTLRAAPLPVPFPLGAFPPAQRFTRDARELLHEGATHLALGIAA